MKSIAAATLVASALAAGPALAQQMTPFNQGWYFGAGIGQGHLGVNGQDLTGIPNASVSNTETTYTLRAGWRFMPFLALEVGYYDLGKYSFHSTGATNIDGQAKIKSVGGSLVGILPIDQFDLYGRIGWVRSEVKVNASAPLVATTFNEKDHQNEATYGVGGRWNFMSNWGVFAEWFKNDKTKIDSYVAGIDFRF
jgi:OOP family OmpA-OmpF porin